MVVRLQTEEGNIKKYQTVHGVSGAEGGCYKWITKCGSEWDKEPEPHQECNHLECAIYLAKDWQEKELAGLFFGAIAFISFGIATRAELVSIIGRASYIFVIFICSAVLAIILLSVGRDEEKRFDELNEFKNNGTINGIKAYKITEDPRTQ
jgi:hypothetical protein